MAHVYVLGSLHFTRTLNMVRRRESQQSDNVLFEPNRNVLLTEARWGVGNGPTPDDTEGARPAGRAEESQEEANRPEAGGGDRRERAASAAHAAELKGTRR